MSFPFIHLFILAVAYACPKTLVSVCVSDRVPFKQLNRLELVHGKICTSCIFEIYII